MRQYVIDEIKPQDYERIKNYLDKHFEQSTMAGIYWIPVDYELLNDIQKQHTDCQPFYFAVELLPDRLVCELLVRTKNCMRCSCMGMADEDQRNWFITFADSIFERLGIRF